MDLYRVIVLGSFLLAGCARAADQRILRAVRALRRCCGGAAADARAPGTVLRQLRPVGALHMAHTPSAGRPHIPGLY